ncbi:MAG: hypothetical protein HFJ38_05750 [Bacilli bacterium]|nr:hypothetical protein [Bacilli bacterium]
MEERNKQIIINFFNQMLNVYEFELMIDINKDTESIFRLIDMQKVNLGNIEQEEFYSLEDIINKLDIYHNDYIYKPLEDRKMNKEKIRKDDWDMVAKRYLESDTVAKILGEVQTTEYKELTNNKANFSINDMIKILEEEEKFYESVCQKYVKTMSKEMIIKTKKDILHIYIEDDYIELKENGKINKKNFTKYLDNNFGVYHYETCKEFFDAYVKDCIAYDLDDLELMEGNGKWSFYISFEELKRIGYGYMVKGYYPLIEKYAVPQDKLYDFYEHFSLKQLNLFEKTLEYYFVEKSIIYDEKYNKYETLENYSYDSNILDLACGMKKYEDFISKYAKVKPKKETLLSIIVREYYKENKIKDLKDYGEDNTENYHFTDLYKGLLQRLDIKCEYIYTEEKEPGEYTTTVEFDVNNKYCVDTKGYDDIYKVVHNLDLIGTEYKNFIQKQKEKIITEVDYEINNEYNYN